MNWLWAPLWIAVALAGCKDDLEGGRKPLDDGGTRNDGGTNPADGGGDAGAGIAPFLMCLTSGVGGTMECDASPYLQCIARECSGVTETCGAMCEALGECVAEASDVCTCPVEPDCQGCLTGMLTTCAAPCASSIPPCAFEGLDDAGVTSDKTCDDLLACCDAMSGTGKDDCTEQHHMLVGQGDTACGVYAEALGCP